MNSIVLIGRLTRDAELNYLPSSGTAKTTFTLAVNRDYKNKDGEIETDFIPVEFLGKRAETIVNYIRKGSLVGVNGNLRIERYTDELGNHRAFAKVFGNNIQFLDSKKNNIDDDKNNNPTFEPHFADKLDPNGFQAIDDDDIPF